MLNSTQFKIQYHSVIDSSGTRYLSSRTRQLSDHEAGRVRQSSILNAVFLSKNPWIFMKTPRVIFAINPLVYVLRYSVECHVKTCTDWGTAS